MNLESELKRIAREIVAGRIKNRSELEKAKAEIARKLKLGRFIKNAEIYEASGMDERIRDFLRIKPVRSISGVSVIAVMIKPLSCPFRCIYCPTGDAAKSYVGVEPSALRAKRNNFDPYLQTKDRLRQFEIIGHPNDKCEVIIMGGTFLSTSPSYQEWFVKRVYDALNGKASGNLEEAKKTNETAKHRCIGLTIETRPDFSREKHINRMLEFGATRVELGVQTLDDGLLEKVKRGHGTKEVREATQLLKDSSFKIVYHWMPGLTGLEKKDLKRELKLFREMFENPAYRPDMLKIYPTLVIPGTELFELWKNGEYEALTEEETIGLIAEMKQHVPEWVRIMRIQRDIAEQKIVAGNRKTNLRQLIHEFMDEHGMSCKCIRCREIGRKPAEELEMVEREYKASHGREIFISFESPSRDSIAGYLRLRFPFRPFREELLDSALIRELHVYGSEVPVGEKPSSRQWQHRGLGRKLMERAEEIAKQAGYGKIAVISGVGVREYYRKLGYFLEGPYMVKRI